MKKIYFSIFALLLFDLAYAQVPRLLKNIKAGSANSSPTAFLSLNDTVYFSATDSLGTELWKTDGTMAGTQRVKDIFKGIDSSNITMLIALNNDTFLFAAEDSANGIELWRSNGSDTGTVLVKNIYPGKGHSSPSNLVNMKGKIYFFANDSINGTELWVSDGTSAGTSMVLDIDPTPKTGCNPSLLTKFRDSLLLFSAFSPANGQELWISNGTAGGTALVKNIMPTVSSTSITAITQLGNIATVIADSTNNGLEPWRTDGTAAGTYKIKEIFPGIGSSQFFPFLIHNGALYGRATNGSVGLELWKTDGTAANTVLVKDFVAGPPAGNPLYAKNHANGFFLNSNNNTNGYELWTSDGTTTGTVLLKDINPGNQGSFPASITPFENYYVFSAQENIKGRELYKTDGTANGTVLMADLNLPAGQSSSPYGFTPLKNNLVFAATDSNGTELWYLPGCNSLSVTVNGVNASTGPNTGSATAVVSGGTAGFSFSWNNGDSTSFIDSLTAGNYTVTVTDTNGCVATATVSISNVTGISQSADPTVASVQQDAIQQMLHIQLFKDQQHKLELLNQLGQIIYRKELSAGEKQAQISLDMCSPGIYFIRISNSSSGFLQRFPIDR